MTSNDQLREMLDRIAGVPGGEPCNCLGGDRYGECDFCKARALLARLPPETPAPLGYEDIEGELNRVSARLNAVWKHCRVVFYPSVDDPRGNYPLEHAPGARKDMRSQIEGRLEELARPTQETLNSPDDAARYRWLRKQGFTITDPTDSIAEWTFGADEGVHVEAAIDAWMSGGKAWMEDDGPGAKAQATPWDCACNLTNCPYCGPRLQSKAGGSEP